MTETTYTAKLSTVSSFDVVVVGGGPAGVAAAAAAGRHGARTLLIEQQGCLGGMMTVGLVTPVGAHVARNGERFGGILWEVLDSIADLATRYAGATAHKLSCPVVAKHVLLDTVLRSNVELMLHTSLVDVFRENDRITGLVVQGKSGLVRVDGRVFIDATGDADLVARAGEAFVLGSEPGVLASLAETQLNRVHGDERVCEDYDGTGHCQPVSIMFTMGGVKPESARPLINQRLTFADLGMTREDFLKLPYANTPGFAVEGEEVPLPQGRILFFNTARTGEVVVNMSRITDINGADADDLTRGEILAQQQVFALVDFLKRFVPGFEDSYLIETASTLGVRETRRLVGQYVLSGREAIECIPFDDVVAHGSYIIDIHDPLGRRKALGGPIKGNCYDIPYRSLLPCTVQNLLVSGRCISADHVAHSSTRVQGTCMLTGQAAGTAAALCCTDNCTPAQLDPHVLQTVLLKDGVVLHKRDGDS